MTTEEFIKLLERLVRIHHELPEVECKGAGRRTDKSLFFKVVRATLGLANRRNGGSIIIGVDSHDRKITPVGLSAEEVASWDDYDTLADAIAPYADPSVSFEVEVHEFDGKQFVLLIVEEFKEMPVLCARDSGDKDLRKGACYVRTHRKPETMEIPSQTEMRELLDLAAEKLLQRLLAQSRRAADATNMQTVEIPQGDTHRRHQDKSQSVSYQIPREEVAAMMAQLEAKVRWRDVQQAIENRDWPQAEQYVREVLTLDPTFPAARSTLGIAMCDEVEEYFLSEHGVRDMLAGLHRLMQRDWKPPRLPPTDEAISWLEEAHLAGDFAGGRTSAALALLYGVTNRYTEMLDQVQIAIETDQLFASILQVPNNVIMLAHACGNDADSLQELGQLIGLHLPAPIPDLRASIESVDLTRHDLAAHGIVWFAMGQPSSWTTDPSPHFPTAVHIYARDESGERLAGARYFMPPQNQPLIPTDIPSEPGEALPVADLVSRLDELFLFLCPAR